MWMPFPELSSPPAMGPTPAPFLPGVVLATLFTGAGRPGYGGNTLFPGDGMPGNVTCGPEPPSSGFLRRAVTSSSLPWSVFSISSDTPCTISTESFDECLFSDISNLLISAA